VPMTVTEALELVYTAIQNDNRELMPAMAALKTAMAAEGVKEVEVDPKRLPNPNRQGRKLMQAFFRQRGIAVTFKEAA